MDWDFGSNESPNKAAYNKGVFEGGQMEKDAVQWITDKICTIIYDEMKAGTTERQRAAITAAMPMMAVAAIVTFTNVAAKPQAKHKLRAQSLMLKAALDFTTSQLEKVEEELKALPPDAEDSMYLDVQQAMDDMHKMSKDEWIEKHGNLVNKIDQLKSSKLKKRGKGE